MNTFENRVGGYPGEDEDGHWDDCLIFIPSCGCYYHMETEESIDAEMNVMGKFLDVWGDYPEAFEPEAFGIMDENEFEDIGDLAFRFIRLNEAFKECESFDEAPCMSAIADSIMEEEGLNSDILKLSLSYGEVRIIRHGSYQTVGQLTLRGCHPKIGPVWSSKSVEILFPTDFVEFSNAVLDLNHHCDTVQILTHGCPHCWRRLAVDPTEEIAEEYGCDYELVEDLVYATNSGELPGYGAVQPDCPVCMGIGIDTMGGWESLVEKD